MYSNLISTLLDGCQVPELVSIEAQSYPALTSQSLRATIGLLQDNWPLSHYVIGISGILPYNRNVTLQTLELFSAFAWLYNSAASPASHLCSAGSLAIITYTCISFSSHFLFIFVFIFYNLPPLFFIFPTTSLKYNNPCNCSACLVLTIIVSSFLLIKFNILFFAVSYFMF